MRTQKIESKKSATKSVGKDFTGISDLGFGANNSTLGNRDKSKDGGGCCCCCCCSCCCSAVCWTARWQLPRMQRWMESCGWLPCLLDCSACYNLQYDGKDNL